LLLLVAVAAIKVESLEGVVGSFWRCVDLNIYFSNTLALANVKDARLHDIPMIVLNDDTVKLIERLESGIDKELMQRNWEEMMEIAPILSGSEEEERAIMYMKEKFEGYGMECNVHRFDAYLSQPKYSKLKIVSPVEMEVKCTPYRQVASTGPEGFEADLIYIPPEDLGYAECRGKIVLCEQKTSGDWMGLRNGFLLRLQNMGIAGLVVIEQDDYKDFVMHQRADFSVSGSPTSDNIGEIQTIPAILHINNKDGKELREIVKKGGVRVHIVSEMNTGWKSIPLLETEIKGNEEADKFILVNAHIDTPPFSPGVVDNLSGDVAVMELARLINAEREHLRRSVRIVIWPGHEIGRYAGSTWYNDFRWHELRHRCIASYNIDSPGTEGATKFRNIQVTEVMDAALESVKAVTGEGVESFRWATRAGDGSFWGTGMPHVSITTSRPEELYDPHVNYSGGGWWWHTPYATMEHGDVNVLEMDVKAEMNFIIRMVNSPVLPLSFGKYAERMHEILVEMQGKSEKVRDFFNLDGLIKRAKKFIELSRSLERTIEEKTGILSNEQINELNESLMWVSRHVNPVAHSNAGPSEQMSMETFGALPFPRIAEIIDLAGMDQKSHEFNLLHNKLVRQRNTVEEGFYQANQLIARIIESLS